MRDRAGFERRALIHLDSAYSLALWLLRLPADAEDAVQDAAIKAYRAFDQLQGQDAKPWLLTIVRNVCYRRLQQRWRDGNVISLDEALSAPHGIGDIPSGGHSPEQAAIGSCERAALETALSQLPPVFREVIVLREIEELSYLEIADVIGAPVGTVMSRLSRARAVLRTQLRTLLDRDDSNAL